MLRGAAERMLGYMRQDRLRRYRCKIGGRRLNRWFQPSIAIFQSRLSFEGAGKLICDSIQFDPRRANAIDIAFVTHAFLIRFTTRFIGSILDRSTLP